MTKNTEISKIIDEYIAQYNLDTEVLQLIWQAIIDKLQKKPKSSLNQEEAMALFLAITFRTNDKIDEQDS